jgi:hypothetical protein
MRSIAIIDNNDIEYILHKALDSTASVGSFIARAFTKKSEIINGLYFSMIHKDKSEYVKDRQNWVADAAVKFGILYPYEAPFIRELERLRGQL